MKAFVGVTDERWYRFLAERPALNEVNFWRPSGGTFRALTPGEPFLFKAHFPLNRVVGGGFFSGFTQLRISEAWELFGEANGASSIDEMRRSVGRYRKQAIGAGEDPIIGCIFVRDVTFFPDESTVDPPPAFASNVVQGKTYNLADADTASYFDLLIHRLIGTTAAVDLSGPWHRPGPVYGDPRLVPQRLGQQSFKAVVLGAYGRRCAITGNRVQPVLQAAHIRPLPLGGEHRLDNGLLLKSDVHILFDRGYLGVDPKHRLLVSPRLRSEFGNGDQFYAKAGEQIALPERRRDRPRADFLEWHLDTVYKAA
ncbi:restriction endonuclease [Micromonospora ureilytica]|uniref:Restriction endonuclease n=1 Tax=Micromonospora ureilytica TaxID=709868 RepID=A0A3N9XTW7_9ACTN|nr:HNH endonuclease [Micromonospora ureilytica]MBG6065462.1 putative restriction endonuclease [Micromonospora ureilytica]RQX16548.1 restriction endonuclease [Micromonospora ureilytica]